MAPTNSSSVATSSSDAGSNPDSTFQMLIDGNLHLDGLNRASPMNSVELYGLDYTQGLVAAAVPLSLFGILAYVKAPLKAQHWSGVL
jgi:hypothetical protein